MKKPSKSKAVKPEISYNRDTGQFLNHGEWITDDHLWSLWNDVGSADYTQGAFNKIIDLLQTLRALQFALAPLPENERQILRCAPPFDAQAEHEKDLEYESRVDHASWETDDRQETE